MSEPIPLSELERDLPTPAVGWTAELSRRGIPVVLDDIGRLSIARGAARHLLTEQRQQQEAAARHREEIERRAIEADRAFRASLPAGIPLDVVPAGVSPGMLMMAADPERQGSRRQSVLEHSLANPAGAIVYTPVGGES
jgi:hypothetical protein